MILKSKSFKLLISDTELRSERREVYLPIYEDLGYIAKLDNNKNQVVFGRRGSGKTHLLGSLIEYINNKQNNLAIFVDLKKVTNKIIGEVDADQKSFIYFWSIVEDILNQISQEISRRLSAPKQSEGKREKYIESLRLIESVLKTISPEQMSFKTGDLSMGGENAPRIGFVQGNGAGKSEPSKHSNILKIIEKIWMTTGVKHIIIGFDEWSSLTMDIQPRLADMLNKAFFTSKAIAFKFVTIKFKSQFYLSKKNIGLELGHDIFREIDLDVMQMWERGLDASINFFTGILMRHLNFSRDKLSLRIKAFTKKNIYEMFSGKDTFIELVKASEGIPRDFLNVFKRSYDYFISDTKAKAICIRHIKKAVADWYEEDKLSALSNTSNSYKMLERLVNEIVIGRRTKQFILPSRESSNRELQQLVELRLLHLLKQGWSSKNTPGQRFDVFSIDYGAFIAILASKIGKEVKQLWSGDSPLPEVNLRDIRRKEFSVKNASTKNTNGKSKQAKNITKIKQETLPLFDL